MMGLVDYGSDSGSEADEAPEDVGTSAVVSSSKSAPLPSTSNGQDDSYFAADDVFEGSSALNLPSVIESTSTTLVTEGELEDIVKPKEWELKMAEKERRRKEKKAKKKEKKRKDKETPSTESLPNVREKTPRGKAKIAAFGALNAIVDGVDNESDEEQTAKPSNLPSKPKGCGLLAMLPTPKGGARKSGLGGAGVKGTGILLPPSLRNKSKATPTVLKVVNETTATKRPAAGSDDSDDDDLPTDFFGLSSAPEPKVPKVGDIPALVNGVADVMGPSRLQIQEDIDDGYGYPEVEPSSSDMAPPEGVITDEEAHRLIMKYEINPMGLDHQRSYNSVAAEIVDIRVDDALGPDVRANILKNLHTTARAKDATAPLPKSKNPADATSRRKHQITYLANLAVAREEALQQQWAESKQMRRIGRQKYGF
ncbi:hypothetical protein NECAME_09007 [Necator americanus]|uniref:Proline-rich protein PRCC n=1 Tax=Necator americanus TaxID=51031 RepID=W2TF54_NECAM|nr:hypothetical protein NECAME_09007 [Necator americanus]ETN80685.1 hypothetical protein NECAME_09007 [Necator americanus]